MKTIRSFAPNGMLEYWNCGMMEIKELYPFKKNVCPSLLPNIPLLQHSIIPCDPRGYITKYII
jgi:hypothetical protein